ncbi:MAG: hypothetical protein HQL33_09600 [Alphaproteobacteria bacterium]|nr:hypothetical protein [Alphaproteobacteria bacterium]
MTPNVQASTLTIRIPMKFRRQGGHKQIIVPDGLPEKPVRRPDEALLKALVRAHRWKRLIDTGQVRNIREIAEAEKLGTSYVSRIFRLTLLAPEIVEAILDGRHPRTLSLADLIDELPVEWERQREGIWVTAKAAGDITSPVNASRSIF